MRNQLNLYEQIKETMLLHSYGTELSTAQIRDEVARKYGTNKDSIIPTDYCYNRCNKGIDFNKQPHLFDYIKRGRFIYIGENAVYNGYVIHCSKDSNKEQKIGIWEDGKLIIF